MRKLIRKANLRKSECPAVSKIPISNASIELVEMDFVDIGGRATFSAYSGYFFRVALELLALGRKEKRTNGEKVRAAMISNWLIIFGTPDIIMVDKDTRFDGNSRREFCYDRNITRRTVIPAHRQSLGGGEGRQRLFMGISGKLREEKKASNIPNKEREEYTTMCTLHLNSQVQQYGGVHLAREFMTGRLKFRLARYTVLILTISRILKNRTSKQSGDSVTGIRKIHHSPANYDFNGKLKLRLNRRFVGLCNGGFFLGGTVFFCDKSQN